MAVLLLVPFYFLWPPAAEEHSAGPFNLVIVSVDTLRADHLSAYGSEISKTPHIDRLALDGVLFLDAQTTAPLTLPAHASLMTGRTPVRHGVRDNIGFRLSDGPATLATSLKNAGYDTGAFVGSFVLDSTFGLARGFDHYFDEFVSTDESPAPPERRGDEVLKRALAWLSRPRSQPFFAFLHFYDPHTPYAPPAPFAPESSMDRDLYAGEVAYVDSLVGRLTHWLEEHALDANTVVVLTSDHGESLGEHDERTHGLFLYESTLRIPLVLRYPGARSGTRVSTPVRIIDVAPTVLDLLERPIPAGMDGRSLRPLVESPKRGSGLELELPGYAETYYPRLGYGWSELRSLRRGKYKMILAPRAELYDLTRDPNETNNLIAALPSVAEDMRRELEQWASASSIGEPESLAEETVAALRSLGYVSGGTTDLAASFSGLADPKDRVHSYHLVNDPELHTLSPSDGPAFEEAVSRLSSVLIEDPGILYARVLLGQLFMKADRMLEAIDALESVLQIAPDNFAALYDLAAAHIALGELDAAETDLRRAITLDERNVKPYLKLAELERGRQRHEAAEPWIVKALEIEPGRRLQGVRAEILIEAGRLDEAASLLTAMATEDESDATTAYNLGQVLLRQGRLDEAVARLERAEASDTADPAIPFAMGNALAAYGRHEAAARAYRRAIAIDPCLSAAHANLGTAQHQLGFLDEAIRSYRRAIACDGAYAKAHLNLASALQERGDLASAIASLEAAHELRPDDAALASTLRELKEHAASQNQSQP